MATKFIIQLRGLPFSATPTEIVAFLGVDPNLVSQVELTKQNNGRPSGECFCVVTEQNAAEACVRKHKEIFGDTGRYAEVYKSTPELMNKRVAITLQFDNSWDGIVRVRGLPFVCSEDDVRTFFQGLTIAESGISCAKNKRGQTTGEGFVQFQTFPEATQALQRNKNKIGERYIEVFKASNNELRRSVLAQRKLDYHAQWCGNQQAIAAQAQTAAKWGGLNINGSAPQTNGMTVFKQEAPAPPPAATPPPSNNPYPHIVSVSGLPLTVITTQIQEFFKPHRAVAVNVRGGGLADVAFKTHDTAAAAMVKQGGACAGAAVALVLNSQAQPSGWNQC